jgi:hypothetical protein
MRTSSEPACAGAAADRNRAQSHAHADADGRATRMRIGGDFGFAEGREMMFGHRATSVEPVAASYTRGFSSMRMFQAAQIRRTRGLQFSRGAL